MDVMQLDNAAAGPGAVTHDVDLVFAVAQSGEPFVESKTTYHHCTDPVVAFALGNIVAMTATLGPKGKKAKDGPFSVEMTASVDGAQAAKGSWDGMSREGALLFERQVLEIWLHMNQQSTTMAKAYGKI